MRLGMFETSAVVLSSGTGWSDLAPLCAIDKAMHPQQQANYHQVTSLVPSGSLVYRLKTGAAMVNLDGAHIPAVMHWQTGRYGLQVCAGVGVGLPESGTGLVYHDAGRYGPEECKARLEAMVAEAMAYRGVKNWTFHSDVAFSPPDPEYPQRYRAAIATAVYLDEPLLTLYEHAGVLVPL